MWHYRKESNMKQLMILILLLSAVAYAAPAAPGERAFTQPDGSQFRATLKGDEWFNWVALDNGYVALYSHASKAYEYAVVDATAPVPKLAPSGVAVTPALQEAAASPSKALMPPQIKPISPETLRAIGKEKRKAMQRWR